MLRVIPHRRFTRAIDGYICKLVISKAMSTAAPSATTSILLHKIPNSITNAILSSNLNEIKPRKVFIEPGFTFHLTCPAERDIITRTVPSKSNSEVIKFKFPPF